MMPRKITLYENHKYGLDAVIMGIGEFGAKTMANFPYPKYEIENTVLRSLFLCDDGVFQRNRFPYNYFPENHDKTPYLEQYDLCEKIITDEIGQKELLISFLDGDVESDCNSASEIVKLLNVEVQPLSVCVYCGEPSKDSMKRLLSAYDSMIYVSDRSVITNPVTMLLYDMYELGLMGIDYVDIPFIFKRTPMMKYFSCPLPPLENLHYTIDRIRDAIKCEKDDSNHTNAFVCINCNFDNKYGDFYEATTALYDFIDGEISWMVNVKDRFADGDMTVSIIYGADVPT